MSKKSRKKSATSLEAQARAHETLYGKDWYEVGVYRRQAQEIIKKAKARLEEEEIAEKEKNILRKRLKEYGEGRREIDKSLLFYKILERLNENKPIDLSDDRVKDNLKVLEELEYIKNMGITAKGKKMLKKK
ncbi:MAG: hypothetical protein JW778_01525, partial [Candidatus Altiarchaeota archaeon]|nr:hypothetical protein [Candidatus Altiarchaeota archaeon]